MHHENGQAAAAVNAHTVDVDAVDAPEMTEQHPVPLRYVVLPGVNLYDAGGYRNIG
jgi:hypothetical protein